jgi:hypothetical protein
MKKITLLLSFIACVVLAQGQTLFVDNFNYTTGTDLLSQGGWSLTATAASPNVKVATGSLSYTGYPSSGIGNSVALSTAGQDVNNTFTNQKTGFVYAAALVNITTAGTGDYFIHFGELTSTTAYFCRTYVKADGANIAFGVTNCSGGTPTQTYTASTYILGTTYLLVLKVDVVTGASSIIVNPTLNVEPTTGWAYNNSGTTVPTPANGIGTINLRQGSTTAGISPTLVVDGIRVATSYSALFTTTGLFTPKAEALSISLSGTTLTVKDVAEGSIVDVYSTLGAKVQSAQLVNGAVQLKNLSKGLYIVRVGNQSSKIMM